MTDKVKKPITDKQREARLKSLARGREIRLQNLKDKKDHPEKYNIDSDSDDGEKDYDFMLSKTPKTGTGKVDKTNNLPQYETLQKEIQEIKALNAKIIEMHKKEKYKRQAQQMVPTAPPANNYIMVPTPAAHAPAAVHEDPAMAALRRSIFGK